MISPFCFVSYTISNTAISFREGRFLDFLVMKNWKSYMVRQNKEYTRIPYPEQVNAEMVVVIPCYNESSLEETLQSLRACQWPGVNVLVAVVVNSGEQSEQASVLQNRTTYNELKAFALKYNKPALSFFPLLFEGLPRKHAGVGLARKIGMDLAVDHFLRNETPRGVIISLDADCLVSPNYLASIHDAFQHDPRLCTTIHTVTHRVEESDQHLERSIRQYEAYLRYFRQMLMEIGFPYYYRTIGSAFAVTADAYVKVGGMGRQQGGEDFYFLHKVFELGKVKELDEAVVYPLARYSDRVPFGTGPALQKMMQHPKGTLDVYSRQSFLELKRFFDLKDTFYKRDEKEVLAMLDDLHPALLNYLDETGVVNLIRDCNGNSARLDTFRKRFFHHFNAFRIIKYLNQVHPRPFPFDNTSLLPPPILYD